MTTTAQADSLNTKRVSTSQFIRSALAFTLFLVSFNLAGFAATVAFLNDSPAVPMLFMVSVGCLIVSLLIKPNKGLPFVMLNEEP